MISHEHKCIFIHIPKCAGTSIESAFGHFSGHVGRGGQDHRTIRMIEPVSILPALAELDNQRELARRIVHALRPNPNRKNKLGVSRQQYRDYFKFTIVRNPWTRAASLYNNVMRDRLHKQEMGLGGDTTFAQFMRTHTGKGMLRPQLDWITDWRGDIPLDYIGRFENLAEDFDHICSTIGSLGVTLPSKNVDSRQAAAPVVDHEVDRMIIETYSREIELFGYVAPDARRD